MQQARRREPGGRRGGERGAPGRSRPQPPPAAAAEPGSGGMDRCEGAPRGLCGHAWDTTLCVALGSGTPSNRGCPPLPRHGPWVAPGLDV